MEIEGSDAQMYVLRPLVALADNNRSVTACPAHIVVVLCRIYSLDIEEEGRG